MESVAPAHMALPYLAKATNFRRGGYASTSTDTKRVLLHYMAHCSTLFFTIEKIKMKNHSLQNIIFKQIWTFLDNLTKIRKKSMKKTFFSQWKKQLFHTVKKIFNSLWKKHLIHCEKNNCFTVWKKQLFKKLS